MSANPPKYGTPVLSHLVCLTCNAVPLSQRVIDWCPTFFVASQTQLCSLFENVTSRQLKSILSSVGVNTYGQMTCKIWNDDFLHSSVVGHCETYFTAHCLCSSFKLFMRIAVYFISFVSCNFSPVYLIVQSLYMLYADSWAIQR